MKNNTGVKDIVVMCGRSLYQLWTNRRKSPRVPVTGNVLAIYIDTRGRCIRLSCSGLDFCPRGMAIDSPEAIPAGTELSLSSGKDDSWRLATVRYCVPTEGSFRVGLEFSAGASNQFIRDASAGLPGWEMQPGLRQLPQAGNRL